MNRRIAVVVAAGFLVLACRAGYANGVEAKVEVSPQWQGLYPVDKLELLPKGQQAAGTGFISDAETFEAVWKAFKADEELPKVDFEKQLVVFARNVTFLNNTRIIGATVRDDALSVLAIETRTARPIEDKVYMALGVVSREGFTAFDNGQEKIEIDAKQEDGKSGAAE